MIDINKVEEQAKWEIAQESMDKAKKAIKEELRALEQARIRDKLRRSEGIQQTHAQIITFKEVA